MPNRVTRSTQVDRSMGLFILVLLAVFATELAVTKLFNTLLSRLSPVHAGLADGLLLIVLFTPPLWAVCHDQLARSDQPARHSRKATAAAIAKVLLVIFLIEVLVTLILPRLMPGADDQSRDLADACLSTLLSAPPLWWLLFFRKARPSATPLSDLLGIPLRLYVLLLVLIFLVDLMQALLFSHSAPGLSDSFDRVVEAFLTTVVISPVLWLFVIRPLQKVARSDRARASAIHDQVNDGIVSISQQGIIATFNPAAQRIFGYQAEQMTGQSAACLFLEGDLGLAALIPDAALSEAASCREITGKRLDGTPITLEVSVSRMQQEKGGHLLIMRDISDRKKAEQVLLESLSLQTATLESTADGILAVDLSYRVRSFNRKFLQMWQVSRELVEDDDRGALQDALLGQLQQPESLKDQIERLYRQPGQTAVSNILLRDGRVFECYSYPQMLDGRVVGRVWSFRDISEKIKAEESLRQSEELFRQVFDQTEDAIVFFRLGTCRILDLNRKAERIFGYSKAELQELGLERLCRPEDYLPLCNSISCIGPQRAALLDNMVCRRKDGDEIIVSMRGKILTLKGSQVIYCTFRDITDRIRMEREARNMQAKLIQANKMTSLGLLVSGVAHEINNPNNYIMANSRLLSRAWLDALKFLREYYRENGEFQLGGVPFSQLDFHSTQLFEGIIDGTQRIESIINNLKGFARKDRAVEEIDIDLNQVANSAVTLLHHELVKFTANFQVDLAPRLPKVKGNIQQLGQVIINLLTNACHALPDRDCGIWLCTGFDEVQGEVTISVRDEGCGISRDDGSRILEPFFTTKLDSGGTGLGLSISHSIVKDHSGRLEFSSEQGKGTVFTVRLPAQGGRR